MASRFPSPVARLVFCSLMTCLSALVARSPAQCTKDVDCKGNRVCVDGECRDPSEANRPATSPQPATAQPSTVQLGGTTASEERGESHSSWHGWGVGGAVIGFAFTPISAGLTIGAMVARDQTHDVLPALPLGLSAIVIDIIAVPVVSAGGSSSRRNANVDGITGLRIVSWILYGVGVAGGLAMVGMGIAEVDPGQTAILLDGIALTASTLFMSIDALASSSQAARKLHAAATEPSPLKLSLGPTRQRGVKLLLSYSF